MLGGEILVITDRRYLSELTTTAMRKVVLLRMDPLEERHGMGRILILLSLGSFEEGAFAAD